MVGLTVVGVLVLAGGTAGIWGIRRLIAQSGRVTGMPDAVPETTFLGGLLSSAVSVTWPLIRLDLLDWGIRLRGSARPVCWLIAPWEARYEELASAQIVSSMSTGIRFAALGNTDAVVFWNFKNCSEILDQLDARGVSVDRQAKSLRQAGGIHRGW